MNVIPQPMSSTRRVVAPSSIELFTSRGLLGPRHTQRSLQTARARSNAQPPNGPLHIIGKRLFTSMLIRERKRAERADQPLVLMIVRLQADVLTGRSAILARTISALTATSRETDILGWLEVDAAIGVIFTDVPAGDPMVVDVIERRVRLELAEQLGAPVLANLSIRLHVHPDLRGLASKEVAAVDPLLLRIRPAQEPATFRDPLKRALDIVGSLALLAALAPVLLVIMALVKPQAAGPGLDLTGAIAR